MTMKTGEFAFGTLGKIWQLWGSEAKDLDQKFRGDPDSNKQKGLDARFRILDDSGALSAFGYVARLEKKGFHQGVPFPKIKEELSRSWTKKDLNRSLMRRLQTLTFYGLLKRKKVDEYWNPDTGVIRRNVNFFSVTKQGWELASRMDSELIQHLKSVLQKTKGDE